MRDFSLKSGLLLSEALLARLLLFLGSALSDVSLEVVNVDFSIVVMRLVLVNVIPIDLGELLQDFFLVLSPHLLLIASFLHSRVDFVVDLALHFFGHRLDLLELAHSVHVVLFWVQLKLVESVLLLLVVNLLSTSLLLNLFFGLSELVVYGL